MRSVQIISCVTATEIESEGGRSLLQLLAPTIDTRWTENKPTPTQDSTQRNTNIPALLIQNSWSSHTAPCNSPTPYP